MAHDICCMELDFVSALKMGELPRVPPGKRMPVNATVLLVEDDAMVRGCLREVLNELESIQNRGG